MSHQHGQHSPASAFTAIYHTLRNEQTGMYLGAHPDGLLIAEDNDTNHHDIAWKVVSGVSGGIALQSCHGTFLSARDEGSLHAISRENTPECNLHAQYHGGNLFTLRDCYGMFVCAVPPVEGQPQVFSTREPQEYAVKWEVGEISRSHGLFDSLEGKFM
eukprot:TRINITY_DN289_c0_g2_i2.p2 TRINITY_DN289_c0_g2~~TRINITY_DN289_c0_g2_i2.p2  ORF type:complete len:159 (+),score=31.55 TRINITY_DN289_c0_g2_i2:25-501(+)